jgi:hypothetical protein
MSGNKREHGASDKLDLLGQSIIRASTRNEAEAESAATSPFLYTRLRARIDSERVRREEGERWLTLFTVIWRSVPAMALVAAFAVVLFLSSVITRTINGYTDEALLGERDAGVERVVFTTDRQALTSDDVLATIWSDEERGASR